jgi:hypothetical protein
LTGNVEDDPLAYQAQAIAAGKTEVMSNMGKSEAKAAAAKAVA